MTDSTGGSLSAAYEAIKAKDLAKARDVLSEYLVDHPNDADAWWLYSYAVVDVEQGRKALETVLRLDPAYPGARDLLIELENTLPAPAALVTAPLGSKPITQVSEAPKLTATIQPEDDKSELAGLTSDDGRQSGGLRRVLIGVLAAVVVLAIVLVVFVLPNINPSQQATTVANTAVPQSETTVPSSVTEQPTTESSVSSTDVPTTEATTVEAASQEPLPTESSTSEAAATEVATESAAPTADAGVPTDVVNTSPDFQVIYDALAANAVVSDSAVVEPTSLGQTFTVSVCAASAELRTVVPTVLSQLAGVSTSLPSELQAVAAKFVECEGDGSVLRFVALNRSDAQAFAEGTLTEADLRTRLIALP